MSDKAIYLYKDYYNCNEEDGATLRSDERLSSELFKLIRFNQLFLGPKILGRYINFMLSYISLFKEFIGFTSESLALQGGEEVSQNKIIFKNLEKPLRLGG
ncbi:MAG: hypothetical protein RXN81_00045 [Caldisphaera sp.]